MCHVCYAEVAIKIGQVERYFADISAPPNWRKIRLRARRFWVSPFVATRSRVFFQVARDGESWPVKWQDSRDRDLADVCYAYGFGRSGYHPRLEAALLDPGASLPSLREIAP